MMLSCLVGAILLIDVAAPSLSSLFCMSSSALLTSTISPRSNEQESIRGESLRRESLIVDPSVPSTTDRLSTNDFCWLIGLNILYMLSLRFTVKTPAPAVSLCFLFISTNSSNPATLVVSPGAFSKGLYFCCALPLSRSAFACACVIMPDRLSITSSTPGTAHRGQNRL